MPEWFNAWKGSLQSLFETAGRDSKSKRVNSETKLVLTHFLCICSATLHQFDGGVAYMSPKPSAGPSRSGILSSCLSRLAFLGPNLLLLDQLPAKMFVVFKWSQPSSSSRWSMQAGAVTGPLPNLVPNPACSLTRSEGRTTNNTQLRLCLSTLVRDSLNTPQTAMMIYFTKHW